MERVSCGVAKCIVCERCMERIEGIVELDEELPLNNFVILVKRFCYLGVRVECW